eukprot:289153-Chlamydomonas_euryale.AAC.1
MFSLLLRTPLVAAAAAVAPMCAADAAADAHMKSTTCRSSAVLSVSSPLPLPLPPFPPRPLPLPFPLRRAAGCVELGVSGSVDGGAVRAAVAVALSTSRASAAASS